MKAIAWTTVLILAALSLSLQAAVSEPWEFAAELPGALYTYDLMTTERGVYMVLEDSSGTTMGLYKYNRLVPQPVLEFIGKPGEPLYSVHVAGSVDQYMWLGSHRTGASLWYSSDVGQTWVERDGVEGSIFGLDGSSSGDRLYVSPKVGTCFYSSTDHGETWFTWGDCEDESVGTFCIETDFFDPDRAYALAAWTIISDCSITLETTDAGQTWEVVYGPCRPPVYPGVYPSPFRSGDVTVAVNSGDLYTRVNGEWSEIHFEPNFGPVFGIAQPVWDGGALWMATSHSSGFQIIRYADGTWSTWQEGLPQIPDLNGNHEARMWACPITGDVFLTTPGLKLWVYRAPASSAPEISLADRPWGQVCPNPTHGSVTMTLANLPGSAYRLLVYDILGRKVRLLHEGAIEGTSTLRWDGRDERGHQVPTGLYFIRLTDGTGKTRLSKRIVLLDR